MLAALCGRVLRGLHLSVSKPTRAEPDRHSVSYVCPFVLHGYLPPEIAYALRSCVVYQTPALNKKQPNTDSWSIIFINIRLYFTLKKELKAPC